MQKKQPTRIVQEDSKGIFVRWQWRNIRPRPRHNSRFSKGDMVYIDVDPDVLNGFFVYTTLRRAEAWICQESRDVQRERRQQQRDSAGRSPKRRTVRWADLKHTRRYY